MNCGWNIGMVNVILEAVEKESEKKRQPWWTVRFKITLQMCRGLYKMHLRILDKTTFFKFVVPSVSLSSLVITILISLWFIGTSVNLLAFANYCFKIFFPKIKVNPRQSSLFWKFLFLYGFCSFDVSLPY